MSRDLSIYYPKRTVPMQAHDTRVSFTRVGAFVLFRICWTEKERFVWSNDRTPRVWEGSDSLQREDHDLASKQHENNCQRMIILKCPSEKIQSRLTMNPLLPILSFKVWIKGMPTLSTVLDNCTVLHSSDFGPEPPQTQCGV